jgi:hypothetical protein
LDCRHDDVGQDAILNELRDIPGVTEHIVHQFRIDPEAAISPLIAWRESPGPKESEISPRGNPQ